MIGVRIKDEYIGDEAVWLQRGNLNLQYLIAAGIVESWEDMEKVWHHTFYEELRVAPEEALGVLLTEVPCNPKAYREKMVTILFETFQVKKVYIAHQAVMSLYAAGRTTGLVVDAGDGVSHAVEKMKIAGHALTAWMQKLLDKTNMDLTSYVKFEIARDIKEKLCYVAQNYEQENRQAQNSSEHDKQYTMPDKRVITVPAHVRMSCPELLFKPEVRIDTKTLQRILQNKQDNGISWMSLQDLAWASVSASDVDVRKDLCKNIILSGGTTMYEGLADRLKSEIVSLAPDGQEIRVIASADRKNAVWIGASVLATIHNFAYNFTLPWVTAEDYQEHGAAVIHRKCN